MGIPRSSPSPSSAIQRAKIWFSAVTPATYDTSLLVTSKPGEKCALTNCDVACLKRLDPNGPSWYVKAPLLSDWILCETLAGLYNVLSRSCWPCSWWNPASIPVCIAACRVSLDLSLHDTRLRTYIFRICEAYKTLRMFGSVVQGSPLS